MRQPVDADNDQAGPARVAPTTYCRGCDHPTQVLI